MYLNFPWLFCLNRNEFLNCHDERHLNLFENWMNDWLLRFHRSMVTYELIF